MSEFRSYDRRRLSHRSFKDEETSGDFRNGVAIQATMERMRFYDSPMDAFNFTNSVFVDCIFRKCSLKLSSFNAAAMKDVTFIECDLDQAAFKHASFRNVRFLGGRAEYASFEDADIEDVKFDLQLHGADLRFARSKRLDMGESNLWGASVRVNCTNFEGVTLDRRSLEVFTGLLSKTAGNEDLTRSLDGLISDTARNIVKRIVRPGSGEKVA